MASFTRLTNSLLKHRQFILNSLKNLKKADTLVTIGPYLHQNVLARHLSVWKKMSSGLKKTFSPPVDYDVILPGKVSPPRNIPTHILLPPYAGSGYTDPAPLEVEVMDDHQQAQMRMACDLAKFVLDETAKQIGVGITTDELDKFVHELCIQRNCYPSPLNYRGFPKSVCTSVNNVAVHGIPDDRPLKNGDMISIDISVYFGGFHGDCACTYAVGNLDIKGHDLMRVARDCLFNAIAICKPGQAFNEIGRVVSKTAKDFRLKVVPAFCGHGIGSYFHGPPEIMHFENNHPGVMKEGMIFTIEPVLTEGDPDVVILEDGWTAVTLDNARTAQYEHTVLITSTGHEILTMGQSNLSES